MTGVKLSDTVNFEVKEKLGLAFNAKLSFLWGVPYPLPDWYEHLTDFKKILWHSYRHFGDLMTFLLFISNFVRIFQAYDDIRAFTTCTGTMVYIICYEIKIITFTRKKFFLQSVLDSLHKISENLDRNPLKDEEFFKLHHSYYHHVKFFGINKTFAIASGVCTLALFEMIHGFFQNEPKDRQLPMAGWFPYDTYVFPHHSISCLFQLVSYLSFLLKDVAIDLIFLAILVILNTQLIYLRKLLGLIVSGTKSERLTDNEYDSNELLRWWIKQHQMIIETVDDFKKISNPYLFTKYISVAIILFVGGVLVTSNAEYDPVQQTIVLAINMSNLLQLYIFSVMGDAICDNGLTMTQDVLITDVFYKSRKFQKAFLFIVTRCSKPISIRFGDINPLSVHSFGQIVKMTFSYFTTIVQVRAEHEQN